MSSRRDLFYANDQKVLKALTKVMRHFWFAFPFIYLGNVLDLFQVDYAELSVLTGVGLVICFLPTLAERLNVNSRVRRYMCVVGTSLLISMLGTNADIGIYMTYALAMVMSLLFFNPRFTLIISGITYVLLVGSLYFRAPGANHGEFATPMRWWISRSMGFLIEAVTMTAACTIVAKFTHRLLESLYVARADVKEADQRVRIAEMNAEKDKEKTDAEDKKYEEF